MEQFLYKRKIKNNPKLNCIFAFPGIESFALSSIGYISIFKELDLMDEVNVERYYTNSKTTVTPINKVDIIGFSASFELDIFQIFKILRNLKIPFLASERNESHPIIFAGGPVMTSNPLPYSEFFDFVNIGDSNLTETFSCLVGCEGLKKTEILDKLSDIEGIWVCKNGPKAPVKRVCKPIELPTYTQILSDKSFFKNTFIIEIERGCPIMCNFCLASWHNLPARFADKTEILKAIDTALTYTNKIALLGAYVAGHPDFEEILEYIREKNKLSPVELTLSSLRADLTHKNVVQTLVECGALTATIAIEAGSERLRKLINKNLTDAQIEKTIKISKENGLKGLKIYALIGLPHETQDDIDALILLMKKLKQNNKGFDLSVSLNTFIPKAHTPFQWVNRESKKSLENKISFLKKELHKIGVKLSASSVDWDGVQSLLSRYPASLAPYLLDVYNNGGKLGNFKQCWRAFAKKNNLPAYDDVIINPLTPLKLPPSPLPWDFIKVVEGDILSKKYNEAINFTKE